METTPAPQNKRLSFRAIVNTIVLLLILIGVAFYLGTLKKSDSESANLNPPPPVVAGSKTFASTTYGIELTYPDSYQFLDKNSTLISQQTFLKSQGEILGSINVPQEMYPKTNLGQAFLTIAANNNPTVNDCKQMNNFGTEASLQTTKKVGDFTYFMGEITDAAAGNRYVTRIYHISENGLCVEFNIRISYGNIQNYEPGAVSEINVTELFTKLESVISTAKLGVPAVSATNKTYANAQYGFSFEYPLSVEVGSVAKNSTLGTADIAVPGIYVGNYVFVTANTDKLRKDSNEIVDQMVAVAKNPPPQEEGFPTISCKAETVKNAVSIQLVSCTGEGGPAVYGVIKGTMYDIFIDGYSKGWDNSKQLKNLSYEDLKKILETFKFN